MRNEATEHEVDPLALPVGTQVGTWRVTGFRGRGAYGTLYRAERVGHEEEGSAALKLAIDPGDKRFARESWLLRNIRSAYVPRLLDEGVWEHATGAYPYVVMELVDGEPLYEWAWRRNPSEEQVIRVLWQVARAVADTHSAGAVPRDVKGSNVLVRRADGRAFLVDFGAGDYQGAASLTSKLLPPGTPAYRSPEAWGFLQVFRRHPTVHYPRERTCRQQRGGRRQPQRCVNTGACARGLLSERCRFANAPGALPGSAHPAVHPAWRGGHQRRLLVRTGACPASLQGGCVRLEGGL